MLRLPRLTVHALLPKQHAGASSGIPRLLNLLARAAWLAAAQLNLPTVGPEQVQAALDLVPAARDRLHP